MSIDPRSRMRVETVVVRPSIKTDLTNEELLALFLRSLEGGKVSGGTLERFRGQVREAMRYFRRPDGSELPVREWTKEAVWGYVHFAESSLCANFVQLSFKKPVRAMCKADRWQGMMDAETAAAVECATCPMFKRQSEGARQRLGALSRFFTFLASVGAVPFNFVRDVSKEHSNQNPRRHGGHERKRNPSVQEIVRLVNETAHVRRRAFYAASAKWGCRPNEMVALDRYASFGLPTPEGMQRPHGFENGFPAHPHLKPFNEGGQLVYLPEKRDAAGNPLKDKRIGNRWLVVDAELRPILEQMLADWDRRVKRDAKTGLPVGTGLWLNEHGVPEKLNRKGSADSELSQRWFYPECERLGLMRPPNRATGFKGDRADPQRAWTAHSQRHFFEQIGQKAGIPGDWMNHFRGDAFNDERGSYYKPRPEDIQAKYLALVPRLGFKPLAEAPRLAGGLARSEADTHARILREEAQAAASRRAREVTCVPLEGVGEPCWVPQRIGASCLYAARKAFGQSVRVGEKAVRRVDVAQVCARALAWLA